MLNSVAHILYYHICSPNDWKKKAEGIGKLGLAVGAGVAVGANYKQIVDWALGRTAAPPARNIPPQGPGRVLPGNLLGSGPNVGPPKTDAAEPFPWTWVIVGALVLVAIGLAVYLNQDSLFGDDGATGAYGAEWGETDEEPTKKTKKAKRRSSKKRKRRHTV